MLRTLRIVVPLLLGASLAAQAPAHLPHQNACGVPIYAVGAACPPGLVSVPAGWYSGDSHEHIQQCFTSNDVLPPAIYAEMVATNLNVSSPLIWGAGFITPDQFRAYALQYVTGVEDPTTVGDPDKIIWAGIETSGVSCGNLGHMIGLNIDYNQADFFQLQLGCKPLYPSAGWKNDGSGDYSKPVLDHLRQATGAVTGYAHQSWPVERYADSLSGGWDWEDPLLPAYVGADAKCSFGQDMAFGIPKTCGNTHPVLAPFDVALGRIDFIEAFDMLASTCGGPLEKRYFGMYYRLLNAGQRVALSAGTDADCIGLACPPRVYVKLFPGDAFTYDNWTRALAAGRTSLANGPYQFLELTVEGLDPGDTAELTTPGGGTAQVHVKATFSVNITDATTVSDTIEIVQDGVVVASKSFGPLGMGSETFELDIPVTRSGWIAARTASYATHAAAVYTRLDGAPVANCADAEYWTLYADFLDWNLDLAALSGSLDLYVGCSEAEIRDYVHHARKLYAAIRDYDTPPPTGIARLGSAAPSVCAEPAALVTADVPTVLQPFTLRYFNAPPSSIGGLVIATQPAPVPLPVLGAVFHLLINPSIDPIPLMSDEGGYGEIFVPQMPPSVGATVYVQGAWINPAGCSASGILSSSDALSITLQP